MEKYIGIKIVKAEPMKKAWNSFKNASHERWTQKPII